MTSVKYENGTLTYKYRSDTSYFTRFIFYQNETHPRTDQAPNWFNCTVVEQFRYCVFHSEDPYSRLWGSGFKSGGSIPIATDVKFDRYPPTSGGEVKLNGTFIRMLGGPNDLLNGFDPDNPFVVKGNFSDPSFDCTKITFIVPPGCGQFNLIFDLVGWSRYPFQFASPVISNIISDPSKQVITINGNNFYTRKSFVHVYFDGVDQKNINITVNHTQIHVNNFNRVDPGPMSIGITVDEVSTDNNYIYCYPATITSITSVSNRLGGIVTIKGSKLSSTLNSSLIPTITIGGEKQCAFIKSTSTELECQLDPNESGGKNLSVDVNFGGCNSTSSADVTFTYNIPNISNASYSNGIVTLIGTNLGTNNESFIQLSGNGIKDNIKIEQLEVSPDEKNATFKLPHLRCKSFNISFTRDGFGPKVISFSAPLSIDVINRPSVSNGALNFELYYLDCPISSSSTLSISVGNSSANECSIPSLKSSTSDYYETTCSIPYGTGINKQFTFVYDSESVTNQFSYSPPNIGSLTFSGNQIDITIHGNNFGNSTSLIQVYFNGNDITSEIQ
ncbi:hypothetical protein ACTFIU_011264 [Dictyostelium citrinum]